MPPKPRSCGFLIFCRSPELKFLLMKHHDRWDLPKGHVDAGESDLQAAYRELVEETGLTESEVELDKDFQYVSCYNVDSKRYGGEAGTKVSKSLILFVGYVDREKPIELTEHPDYAWFQWNPPHQIQKTTIDPLLKCVEDYFQTKCSAPTND